MADQEHTPQEQQKQEQHALVILLSFDSKHNICAYVGKEEQDVEKFGDMLTFLRRSPIHYAITA